MKSSLSIVLLVAFVLSLAGIFPALADDAALTQELVGSWMGPSGKILLRADGTVAEADRREPGTWKVENGVLLIKFHRQDSFKILSLTDSKLEIQDMYHGRHKGTWTRITATPESTAGSAISGESASRSGERSPQEQLIRDFYASYGTPKFWDNRKEMSKFLTKSLVDGMLKASRLDLDVLNPIIPGNGGFDEKELLQTLAVRPGGSSPAEFLVTFNHVGKPYAVTYLLAKKNGQWRISDIVSNGRSYLKSLPE